MDAHCSALTSSFLATSSPFTDRVCLGQVLTCQVQASVQQGEVQALQQSSDQDCSALGSSQTATCFPSHLLCSATLSRRAAAQWCKVSSCCNRLSHDCAHEVAESSFEAEYLRTAAGAMLRCLIRSLLLADCQRPSHCN